MALQLEHVGFVPHPVPYLAGWAYQRQVHAEVVTGERPDTLLLLEHESVYTAGRRTAADQRPTDGTPVIDVDRGGKITWHGPGQIVGYPIVRLSDPVDVVAHVRRMEQALIGVCREIGLPTTRVDGRSGVWVLGEAGRRDRKVAAVGVRVSRAVTMHGFSLNCDCDLGWAATIVPCGIPDAGVTSLSAELGRPVPVDEVLPVVERHLVTALEGSVSPDRSPAPA
jgi:lipoyl(octanoyl) transferase